MLLGVVLMLAACATSPKTQVVPEAAPFAGFPQGALAYLYVDTVKARPILDAISLDPIGKGNPKTIAAALDKTTSAVAALYPKGSPRRFLVAAQGRYPRFGASLSFTFSTAWKKRRSATGASYWYSPQQGISVLLNADHAFISDGDPLPAAQGAVPPPEAFALFAEDAVLAGWLTEGAMPFNHVLYALEIPLQIPAGQVVFCLQQSGSQYQGLIRIETPSVSQAKALVSLFSLASLFMPNLDLQEWGKIFFAYPPVQDGAALNLRTGLLDAQEVALLFTTFSLYSN